MTNANDLYVLADGTNAAREDVSKGHDGVLRAKNGVAVVIGANGEPQTVGNAAVENKNVEAANAGKGDNPTRAEQKKTEAPAH